MYKRPQFVHQDAENFRRQVFLAAINGIMSRPDPTYTADGSLIFLNHKVEMAWKVADEAVKESGCV